MHYPLNIHLFGLEVSSHLVFEMLAYVLGFRYYLGLRQGTKDYYDDDQRLWLMVAGAAGALLGSKLLGIVEHPQLWQQLSFRTPEGIAMFFSAKTIVGGLLGGTFAIELAKKLMRVTASSGDLFALPLVLAILIGRIGCFSQGVYDGTHGLPTDSFLGMDMGDGIQRHPAQLYEIVFLLLLFCLLYRIRAKQCLADGALYKLFLVSYLFWRLGIDFLKPISPVEPFGLSAIQLACIVGLLYYWKVFVKPRKLLCQRAPTPSTS